MRAATADDVLRRLELHVKELPDLELTRARRDLADLGAARVPFLVPDDVKQAVAAEVTELAGRLGVRRRLRFKETDNSLRQMSNVRRDEVFSRTTAIPTIYRSQAILDAMARVAGEPVHACP